MREEEEETGGFFFFFFFQPSFAHLATSQQLTNMHTHTNCIKCVNSTKHFSQKKKVFNCGNEKVDEIEKKKMEKSRLRRVFRRITHG